MRSPDPGRGGVAADLLALAVLGLLIAIVYWSPPGPGESLFGFDYEQLHSRRMEFARSALFGSSPSLPAWYPREFLGTPFWSNIQSFPFLPTRLLLVLLEPNARFTYLIGVTLAAVLAGAFAFAYARRIGLGRVASATAGWTFACSGFFASRITAGHLPLLEVYFALPMLLWAAEALVQAMHRGQPTGGRLLALGLASGCVMLGGHPQLPVYALAVAAVYLLWRCGPRRAGWPLAALGLGVGCTSFVLVPMSLLIGRSTRVLDLDPATNNLALPYERVLTFFAPWRDGVPSPLAGAEANPFRGYPSSAYFWDTIAYTGWAPWLALLFLAARVLRGRAALDARVRVFLVVAGVAALVLALPFVQAVTNALPGTILRSPGRLIYITELTLALALGVAIHKLLASAAPAARIVVALALVGHGVDLFLHDRTYLVPARSRLRPEYVDAIRPLFTGAGDQRVAINCAAPVDFNRRVDDIGFFDSIMLARSYRFVLRAANLDPRLNVQNLDGGTLSRRALELSGVALVLTGAARKDLPPHPKAERWVYQVPEPAPRAEFFPASAARAVSEEEMDRLLRGDTDLRRTLLLPAGAGVLPASGHTASVPAGRASVAYRRPSSDRIECTVEVAEPGYLRVIESFDPGWSAAVGGAPAVVLPACDALLCVAVPAGRHEIVFEYATPGARTGLVLSLASLLALLGLARCARGLPSRARSP